MVSFEIRKHMHCLRILDRMCVQGENGVFSKEEASINVNSCEETSYGQANTSMPKRLSHEWSLVSGVISKAFLGVFVNWGRSERSTWQIRPIAPYDVEHRVEMKTVIIKHHAPGWCLEVGNGCAAVVRGKHYACFFLEVFMFHYPWGHGCAQHVSYRHWKWLITMFSRANEVLSESLYGWYKRRNSMDLWISLLPKGLSCLNWRLEQRESDSMHRNLMKGGWKWRVFCWVKGVGLEWYMDVGQGSEFSSLRWMLRPQSVIV